MKSDSLLIAEITDIRAKLAASEAEVARLKAQCLKHVGHEHCVTPCDSMRIQEENHNAYLDEKRKREEAERAIETMRSTLKARGDRAYCLGLDTLSRTEALGWEAKVKTGQFGKPELDAHCLAAHWDGKHRAYYDALALLPPAKKSQEKPNE